MGDPKKKHKTYTTPKRPYDPNALMEDLRTIGVYGLRNKRELWKARTELSSLRRRARDLLGLGTEQRIKRERELIAKLASQGLVMENGTLEDVLTLNVESLLERRLQTYLFRRGLANSMFQARQLITHGHIEVNGRKVKAPSYKVKIADETSLDFSKSSPFNNPDHPLRKELETDRIIKEGKPNE
jgi:small subunit ribosomal protein S4